MDDLPRQIATRLDAARRAGASDEVMRILEPLRKMAPPHCPGGCHDWYAPPAFRGRENPDGLAFKITWQICKVRGCGAARRQIPASDFYAAKTAVLERGGGRNVEHGGITVSFYEQLSPGEIEEKDGWGGA